jgi:hypothetical protein
MITVNSLNTTLYTPKPAFHTNPIFHQTIRLILLYGLLPIKAKPIIITIKSIKK